MDTKALRQKILDLAIRGKLVPQDPNDEPASVLLERIRAQKQQMVKEGKLKAKDIKNDTVIFVGEDNLHYEKHADGTVKCIEDEIPFEVPEGWAWTRTGALTEFVTSGSRGWAQYYSDEGTLFLRMGNLSRDSFKLRMDSIQRVLPPDKTEGTRTRVAANDLLFSITAEIGNLGLIPEGFEEAYINQHIGLIRFMCMAQGRYIPYIFLSNFCRDQYMITVSGLKNSFRLDNIQSILIPIPPVSEQVRIVSKLDALWNLITAIETDKAELSCIISSTKEEILSLAIRGHLVPQNPDDEPASVLLDHIRAEKEALIEQGKIKRDKRESTIFRGDDNSYYEKIGDEVSCIDDELPYDIPEGWAWCELQQCCVKEIKRGRSPKYAEKGQVLSFAQKCNQKNGGINIGLALWIDDATIGMYSEDEYMRDGDIIINSTGTGTLGRVGVYHSSDNLSAIPIVPDSHVTVVRASGYVHPSYLYFCLKAMQSSIENMGEGSTNQKELKPLTIQQLRIPLPPYAEQIMICKRVHTMLKTVSVIEAEL